MYRKDIWEISLCDDEARTEVNIGYFLHSFHNPFYFNRKRGSPDRVMRFAFAAQRAKMIDGISFPNGLFLQNVMQFPMWGRRYGCQKWLLQSSVNSIQFNSINFIADKIHP